MTSRVLPVAIILRRALICIIFSLFVTACDSGPGSSPPTEEGVENVGEFLRDLPVWSEFSPEEPARGPSPTGEPVTEEPVTLDVERIDEEGETYTEENVVYQCESQPLSITDTPREIVTYSPNKDILWAGALLQGESHRDGDGSLQPLSIEERAPLDVSIPALANDDNFRTVERPTQAAVDQAIGSMIGGATESGLATPSAITFEMRSYHSESQAALEMEMSGRYLGFEASASGSVERQASTTTVSAQFFQRMYEVVVPIPSSPGAVFSDDFTEARLQAEVDDGHIGPNNLPIYVSTIVYGRMMMFSLTSTASEEDIRATMRAGYQTIGGNVEANLTAKQKTILRESEIKVTSFGGPANATLAVIRSGDWSQYFTDSAPLSTAEPLTYTFRNLGGDNDIARVSESTEYTLRTCTAREGSQATFDLLDADDLGLPIPTPVTSTLADLDGDGNGDLVFNHLGATNEVAVAYANGDGTFSSPVTTTHPRTLVVGGWGSYTLVVGNVNRDERADLVWNYAGDANHTYIAMPTGRGTFDYVGPEIHPGPVWGGFFTVLLDDVNGTGVDDLIWNGRGIFNRTYVAIGAGDGSFSLVTEYQDHPVRTPLPLPPSQSPDGVWANYDVYTGDISNDGRADLVWNETVQARNKTYVGLFDSPVPGSHFDFRPSQERGGTNWDEYTTLTGDIDGANGMDLVFVALGRNEVPIHRQRSLGNGQFDLRGLDFLAVDGTENDLRARLADVNGDGRDDLVVYNTTRDETHVGLATTDGAFDFTTRPVQSRPTPEDWSQFRLRVGDVNGDRQDDLVWIDASARNRVYVGLALASDPV